MSMKKFNSQGDIRNKIKARNMKARPTSALPEVPITSLNTSLETFDFESINNIVNSVHLSSTGLKPRIRTPSNIYSLPELKIITEPPSPKTNTEISTETVHKWKELKTQLTSLDLVFYRGGDHVSDTIRGIPRVSPKNQFSHIGVIITDNILPNAGLIPGQLYVLESMYSLIAPNINNEIISLEHVGGFYGLQIRNLELVVKSYNKKLVFGKIKDNPWLNGYKKYGIRQHVHTLFNDLNGRGYRQQFTWRHPLTWRHRKIHHIQMMVGFEPVIIRGVNLPRNQLKTSDNTLFTSQLIMSLYQKIGLISSRYDAEILTPQDLTSCDFDPIIETLIELGTNKKLTMHQLCQ